MSQKRGTGHLKSRASGRTQPRVSQGDPTGTGAQFSPVERSESEEELVLADGEVLVNLGDMVDTPGPPGTFDPQAAVEYVARQRELLESTGIEIEPLRAWPADGPPGHAQRTDNWLTTPSASEPLPEGT